MFDHMFLSNYYVNAHNPPTVYHSTVCIHPLANTPFSSFEHKMATARFLGFDPEPVPQPSEKYLSTLGGDYVFNDCWLYTFEQKSFATETRIGLQNYEEHVAKLVALARTSGRTLIFPRYMRDKNSWAIPLASLVDVSSLNNLVKWRYLSREEYKRMPEPTVVTSVTSFTETHALLEQHADSRFIELNHVCRLMEDTQTNVEAIQKQIRFCFARTPAVFTRSIGSWGRLCGT